MGDAQHQLQAQNHRRCAKCFSKRGTCGLITPLTIGHPGLPSRVCLPHPTPSVPRRKPLDGVKQTGSAEVAAPPLPLPYLERGREAVPARRSLQLPGADRCTRLPALPLLLEGQPATQKGGVGVGVGEVFPGHQLVPAGRPHPARTPPGSQPALREHRPGACPGAVSSRRCRRRRWTGSAGSARSRASPHCSFPRSPSGRGGRPSAPSP